MAVVNSFKIGKCIVPVNGYRIESIAFKRYKDSDWESGLLINDLIYDKNIRLVVPYFFDTTNNVKINFIC